MMAATPRKFHHQCGTSPSVEPCSVSWTGFRIVAQPRRAAFANSCPALSRKIFFFCFSEICVFILPSRLEQRGVRPIVTKDAADATMPWAHGVAGRVQI